MNKWVGEWMDGGMMDGWMGLRRLRNIPKTTQLRSMRAYI